MAEYNLSEFRKNTRKAFDEAERGEPVYIERYGEDFILISKKNWNDTVGVPTPRKDIKKELAGRGLDTSFLAEVTPPDQKNSSLSQAKKNNNELPGVEEL